VFVQVIYSILFTKPSSSKVLGCLNKTIIKSSDNESVTE